MSVLKTEGLSKFYGKTEALKDVSFEVTPGSVFGILGPNGSGKTTFLGTVLQVLSPTRGRFQWFGKDPEPRQRRRIGTLLETPNYYPYLTATQNLRITASIRGIDESDIGRTVEAVGLSSYEKLPFSKYSLGMKQRLAIGGSLLGNPEVLVLDEPTNGLDPSGIADVRNLIGELHKSGKTIILASHLLDQVEKVCTHLAILKKGKLLQVGSMAEVLREETVIEVGAGNFQGLEKALSSFPVTLQLIAQDGGFRIKGQTTAEAINRHCFAHDVALNLLHTHKLDLESRFLELTDD